MNGARKERAEQLQKAAELLRRSQQEGENKDARIASLALELSSAHSRVEELEAQLAEANEYRPKYESLVEHLRSLGTTID